MSKKLTQRQWAVLSYIKNFMKVKGFQPSQREIAETFNVTPSAIEAVLRLCQRKGYIKSGGSGRGRAVEFLKEIGRQ